MEAEKQTCEWCRRQAHFRLRYERPSDHEVWEKFGCLAHKRKVEVLARVTYPRAIDAQFEKTFSGGGFPAPAG